MTTGGREPSVMLASLPGAAGAACLVDRDPSFSQPASGDTLNLVNRPQTIDRLESKRAEWSRDVIVILLRNVAVLTFKWTAT